MCVFIFLVSKKKRLESVEVHWWTSMRASLLFLYIHLYREIDARIGIHTFFFLADVQFLSFQLFFLWMLYIYVGIFFSFRSTLKRSSLFFYSFHSCTRRHRLGSFRVSYGGVMPAEAEPFAE